MHAMVGRFVLGPGSAETAAQLAEQLVPMLKSMKGFQRATFFGDAENGEYMGVSLWETQEDAEAAFARTELPFRNHIAKIATEPPVRKVCDVWQDFTAE